MKAKPLNLSSFSEKDVIRFFSYVEKTSACWIWRGSTIAGGYGAFFHKNKTLKPHRVSYLLAGNTLDIELSIDHICRNRACVNPEHLRQISNKENVLCGIGRTANNAKKTYCKNGHEFNYENTGIKNTSNRFCIRCHKQQSLASYYRNSDKYNERKRVARRKNLQWLQQEDDQQEVEALTDIKASERK